MSTVTENDLQRLEDLINKQFDLINKRFDSLENEQKEINTKLNDMRVDIATLKEGQNSLNKRIDDTQTGLNKRLDNLDFIARSVIGGIIVALLAGLAKLLYPNLLN